MRILTMHVCYKCSSLHALSSVRLLGDIGGAYQGISCVTGVITVHKGVMRLTVHTPVLRGNSFATLVRQ